MKLSFAAIVLLAAGTTGCSRRLAQTVVDVAVRVAVNELAHHLAKEHRHPRAERHTYVIPPPAEEPYRGPIEAYLPPPDEKPAAAIASVAPPWVAEEVQAAVDAIDLSSCADESARTSMSGRAKILLAPDGHAADVMIEDFANVAPELRACVRLRLRATRVGDVGGRRVITIVDWTTRQPGGV